MAMRKLIICVDQSTGSKSKFGLAAFYPQTIHDPPELVFAGEYRPSIGGLSADDRIREIIRQLKPDLENLFSSSISDNIAPAVVFEHFVMRGAGGETLAKMVGAVIALIPQGIIIYYASNTYTKLFISGHGGGDKDAVAVGVLKYFQESPSRSDVESMIARQMYDALDALAIGITGYHNKINPAGFVLTEPTAKSRVKKAKSKSKTKIKKAVKK